MEMFFQGWTEILRVVLIGSLGYAALVFGLRVSGKRTLAKLNAFDLVVTVALGSTLATVLLSKTVALAEGVTAYLTLIGLQWIVAAASVRWDGVARLVRAEPTLLMHRGRYCHNAMRRARVTENEMGQIIRASAHADPDDVDSVILESDGSFSVIGKGPDGGPARFARTGLPAPETAPQ